MNMNTPYLNTVPPKEITQSYLDALENNPKLFRQFALYAFYGDLCQETPAPIDYYLGIFIDYSEVFFHQLGKMVSPEERKWFITSVELDEFRLRATFFHYWDQGFYGKPFFTGGDRNDVVKQYLLGEENVKRIGLSGETFTDMLKSTEIKEDLARQHSMDDDIIHAIKNLVRERYLVEQRIFFKLLREIGGLSGTTSEVGEKVAGIL